MNIVVINGSPKGKSGVTSQYTQYLERKFPEHNFHTIEVARRIRRLERDRTLFDNIVEQLQQADGVIWSFPVYFMLVPAQLKRFIELLFERVGATAFAGKMATAISTSAHFYDHTAHDYLRDVCMDLGFVFMRGYSAEMMDLLSEKERDHFLGFARAFFLQLSDPIPLSNTSWSPVRWAPADLEQLPLPPAVSKTGDRQIVIVGDVGPDDHNLRRMITLFDLFVSHPVDHLELSELNIRGGCLGCMRCADGDSCVYNDEYATAFQHRVVPADIVIYAGAVKDRYLSARFKTFIDRYFSNGHRGAMNAGAFGVILSGPLNQLASLRETLEATIQVAGQQRLGIVTDEHVDVQATTNSLMGLAQATDRWAADPWRAPATFLGVGGHKVFRDLVYEHRGLMSADHRYYRAQGLYDFPQSKIFKRIVNRILLLCRKIPLLEKQLEKLLQEGRTRPFRRLLEES